MSHAEPDLLELLRLLAEDVPASELEAQAARLGSPDVATTARTLALRVRAVLDSRRRREVELSALVEVARDLASLRDPAGVLAAIVRRARSLLGTDVAYLTLFDRDRGDTFMRATDGSVSARFQALRLPLGAGLGGLVAQTRRPSWTSDYLSDTRFAHTGAIDDAVTDEGIVAICGVPLLVEDAFVGVLFASNRTARPFAHDEVALLASLATLAAVSLVQTRAAAETRETLAALSAAHATVGEQAAVTERAATAHDRFAQVVLHGGGVEDIASALGDLLAGWVVALDAGGRTAAVHGSADTGGLAGHPAVLAAHDSGRLAGAEGVWAVAVSAAGERLGTLVLGGRADLDAGDRRTVERAALVTALVLLFRRQSAQEDRRGRSDLLVDLLGHTGGRSGTQAESLVSRGLAVGVDLTADAVVLVVAPASPDQRRGLAMAAGAAAGAADERATLVAEHAGQVVVLIGACDPSAAACRLADRLGAAAGAVGAAGPLPPLAGLRGGHTEAARTATALVTLGCGRRGASAADLGFAGLVVGERPDVAGYVRSVLGPLLDYDERRGTVLADTVEAWFAAGCSPTAAAATLHVHPNTVSQRLERVGRLLGADWGLPDRALEVQLALRLLRLGA